MNFNLGIALKLGATLAFAAMIGCIKAMPEVATGQVVFARSLFALIPIGLYFGVRGELGSALKTSNPIGHLKRTIAGGLAMALWFAALKLLPLPEALAIGYASPVITIVLAAFVLGERMRIYRWSAVVLGFVGVVVILWPRFGSLGGGAGDESAGLGVLLALASAFFVALAMVQIRQLVAHETSQSIIVIFTISTTIMGLLTAPFGWITPTGEQAALLLGAGLFGGIGQIFLTECYRHADASTIAPFEYVSMIWGLLIGYFLFAEVPGPAVSLGAAIVIAAGLIIIVRERQLGLERGKARPLQPQQN